MSNIIDCVGLANLYNKENSRVCAALKDMGLVPKLTVILVGDNAASQIYVNNKVKKCAEIGIDSEVIRLDISVSQQELSDIIVKLNNNKAVHGILVQMPLPDHINSFEITSIIDPLKDVDGFTPVNTGLLAIGKPNLVPCTPLGVLAILKSIPLDLTGMKTVVLGRSNIVGKPLVNLLINNDFSVSNFHSKSLNIVQEILTADIIIAAIGKPNFITGDMIKQDSIVIDVGITKQNDSILGDCHFASCSTKASYITTVPRGVGPMTIAMLMQNTIKAVCLQNSLNIN